LFASTDPQSAREQTEREKREREQEVRDDPLSQEIAARRERNAERLRRLTSH
jgi:hypothetical protein